MDQAGGLREVMNGRKKGGSSLRVIAVVSGKGGVGKTNMSANIAVQTAKMGNRVLVIDGDLGLANIEILFGLRPRFHLGHLLDAGMEIDDVLATGPHGVKILPAGSGVQGLTRLDDAQKMRLVSALDSLDEKFDVVLVDSGAGIGDNVLFFVGATQESLLVVNPEPTCLTDAYAAVKVLSNEARGRFFNVIVNNAVNEQVARGIYEKLTQVSSRFLEARLRFLGFVPPDQNVHRSVMAQRVIVEAFPDSPAARAITQITHSLFTEPPPVSLDGGLKFLWSRLHRESEQVA